MAETGLAPQPWMQAEETLAVMAALVAAGGPDAARFVGGCVRNAVLGRAVDDVDIATVLTPDQVMRALDAAGLKWVPTGVEHGTVTAIAGGRPFEITTLRRDVATDGRRAVVAFTDDWLEDARRRDFRLNALYLDLEGQVQDPLGEGLADAYAGRIVFVGDAKVRIAEDYLRILRFFRFFAWYGRGAADPAALEACAAQRSMLSACPAERTSKELLKLLAARNPREAVRLMRAAGVLGVVLPAAGDLERFEALVEIERTRGETEPELRLAALLPDNAGVVGQAARGLRLSNAQQGRLAAALADEPVLTSAMPDRAARHALYQAGAVAFRDRVKLTWAADPGADAAGWRRLLDVASAWTRPQLPIAGQDALDAGLPKGPRVGQALKAVEDWWIEADFPADRALALAELRRIAALNASR